MLACVVGVKKGWRAGVGEEEENSGKKNGGVLHCFLLEYSLPPPPTPTLTPPLIRQLRRLVYVHGKTIRASISICRVAIYEQTAEKVRSNCTPLDALICYFVFILALFLLFKQRKRILLDGIVKRSVVSTLLRRAQNIPSTQKGKREETRRVQVVLRGNNYPSSFINSYERSLSKLPADQPSNGFVILPYVQGISERIGRIQQIKVAFKLLRTENSLFPRQSGIAYKISCTNCSFVYYGQTERPLKTRITEHKRAVAMFDLDSKISCHVHENNHKMDFGSARVVGHEANFYERLFLEAWFSIRDPQSGNDHIAIPEVYKSLARA